MKQRFLFLLQELKKVFEKHPENFSLVEKLEAQVRQLPEEKPAATTFVLPTEVQKGEFALFADGACRGNPGPGSWGVLAQNDTGEVIFESCSFEHLTTNNKMELEGAIQALENLKFHLQENGGDTFAVNVHLYSDSKYVVDGLNQWVEGWKARGWKKADKAIPENLLWWQRLDEVRSQYAQVACDWVKGHQGHPQNEYCDALANRALDEIGIRS